MESRSWYTQEKELQRIMGNAADQKRAQIDEAKRAIGNRHARRGSQSQTRCQTREGARVKPATVRLSRRLQEIARELDAAIEEAAGERVAFTLMVFTEGRASYISTAKRDESVREIKHLLDIWEQGMPDVPAHDYAG